MLQSDCNPAIGDFLSKKRLNRMPRHENLFFGIRILHRAGYVADVR